MKRRAILSAIGALLVVGVAGVVATRSREPAPATVTADTAKRDSVWYHESDVALVASTGRPQLLEFFHPS